MISVPPVIFMVKDSSGHLVTSGSKFAWDDMEEARRIMNLSPSGATMLRLETKGLSQAMTIALKPGCKMVYSVTDGDTFRPMVTADPKEVSMILGVSKDALRNQVVDYWFVNEEGKRTKAEEVVYKKAIEKE